MSPREPKAFLLLFLGLLLVSSFAMAFSWSNIYSGGTGYGGGFDRMPWIDKPVQAKTVLDLPEADFLGIPGYVEISGNKWSYFVPIEEVD